MKTASSRCLFALLLLGATLPLSSSSPAGAQSSSQVATPKPKPSAILCIASEKYCGCKGGDDCSILKKFASAGGCSNLQCDGGTPEYCKCQLAKLPAGDSPVLATARRNKDVSPNPLDTFGAPPRRVRDCKATATCGSTTVSCSVKGDGACQGVNGEGVSCTEFLTAGGKKTTTSLCGE